MDYLFFLADLKRRPVLVIGGGVVAVRKISVLRRVGAIVRVVAHMLCAELQEMQYVSHGDLVWIGKIFEPNMLDDVFLVIVATNDRNIATLVYQSAEKRHVFVNVVDDKSKCSLIFPSIIDRSPILIAISSCGQAPVLVRILREKLESLFPNFLGNMAILAGMWRQRVKKHIFSSVSRRRFWEKIFRNHVFSTLISRGLLDQADRFLKETLFSTDIREELKGNVALVGAGPGDSGLFTLRGLQLVQEADIVLYDRLVSEEVLNLIRRDARKICVGKQYANKKCSMKQNDINALLITLAKKGNKVVRLKGGDPFIFGRGGEELEEVMAAGIPCQVVPGITAASAVTIYSGIPLTHRNYSHSVIFLTGYYLMKNYYKNAPCPNLSYPKQTLVIYMGKILLKNISKVLIAHGCSSSIPVAIISRGTCQDHEVSIGTLDNLDALMDIALNPSLLVVGEIVQFRNKINWLNQDNINKYEFTSLINLF